MAEHSRALRCRAAQPGVAGVHAALKLRAAVLGLAALTAGRAAASGVWNLREHSYLEELQDAASLQYVQAIAFDPGGFVRIPPSWRWTMPDGVPAGQPAGPGYTPMSFDADGSATAFTSVVSGTLYTEEVRLYGRFFSAVTDMVWDNDCKTRNSTDPNCLVYPVSALPREALHGARSDSVLLVPYVADFNSGQFAKGKAPMRGSGDGFYANVVLEQSKWKDIIIAGEPYNNTWFIRSPGVFTSPDPDPNATNDRVGRFLIEYDRGLSPAETFGGAVHNCDAGNLGNGCIDRSRGCPVWISTTTGPGRVPLYLNAPVPTDDAAPYTPFSFSFMPGSLVNKGNAVDAWNCADDPVGQMNTDLCDPKPLGTWTFAFGSWGASGDTNNSGSTDCSSVPCWNSRLAGSVYIDGMVLSAARGAYVSPVFDSLSPYTAWENLDWDLELNPDGGGVRTPVGLSWRASNSSSVFGTGSTAFTGSLLPGTGLAGCELDTTGTSLSCSPSALTTGRYFQWRGDLRNWAENPLNPPPTQPDNFTTYSACTRMDNSKTPIYPSMITYDGSLSPRVRQIAVTYAPRAGRFTSVPLSPTGLRAWRTITYRAEDGGGSVTCDIVDAAGNVILANVANGGVLNGIDVGRHPGIAVRFTLDKGASGTADPQVHWFKLTYDTMKGCLAIDRNALRLSRGEVAAIRFCTRTTGPVELKIHDSAGQLVHRLYRGDLKAGEICQKYWWGTTDPHNPATTCDPGDGSPRGPAVAPGLYIVTVITPDGRETARLAVSR